MNSDIIIDHLWDIFERNYVILHESRELLFTKLINKFNHKIETNEIPLERIVLSDEHSNFDFNHAFGSFSESDIKANY